MNSLPKIRSYGRYSSDNYGVNCLEIEIESLSIWFSYKTPVAFQLKGGPRVVIQNYWGPTTAKHLKWIDNGAKEKRVDQETFDRLWTEQVAPLFHPDQRPALLTMVS
jgi:hypothetical protein